MFFSLSLLYLFCCLYLIGLLYLNYKIGYLLFRTIIFPVFVSEAAPSDEISAR